MLNSNVHNPEIQKHQVLSENEFVNNNSGIDGGKDIPRPILQELYHSVMNHEFHALHEPDGIDGNYILSEPHMEGWLRKQGGLSNTWSKRYFVIAESRLFYFKDDKVTVEQGFFALENSISRVSETQRKMVEMVPQTGRLMEQAKVDKETRDIKFGNHTSLLLLAQDQREAAAWVRYLNTAAQRGRQTRKTREQEQAAAAASSAAAAELGRESGTNNGDAGNAPAPAPALKPPPVAPAGNVSRSGGGPLGAAPAITATTPVAPPPGGI